MGWGWGVGGMWTTLRLRNACVHCIRLAAFCLIKPVIYGEALFSTAVKGMLPCAEVTFGMCVGVAVLCEKASVGCSR